MKLKLFFLFLAVCLATPTFAADNPNMADKHPVTAEDTVGDAEKDYQARKSASINKMVGDEYARRGDFDKAADAYSKALPYIRRQLSENERVEIAITLSWGGKLQEAETELQSILHENPANTRARTQLARVLLWVNNPDRALAEAEAVLEKIPDDRDALLAKADALRSKGDINRAITIYKRLLEKSDDFDTRVALCYAYLKQGDVKQAQSSATLLKPEYPYQKQELEKLTAELKEATAQGKGYTLKAEGDTLAAQQQYALAARKYEEVLVLSPRYPTDEWLRMATVMSWGGQHKAARRELEAILAQEPSNPQAQLQLARVLTWMGEFDAAIRITDTILANQPEHREALLVKANATRLRGFHRDADRLYTALLAQGEGFDERLGLTYSYLTGGYRIQTDESLVLLKTRLPYEEKELAQVRAIRDWAFQPQIYGGIGYYDDKDDNEVTTYSTGAQFWIGNWKTNLDYRHVNARAPGRTTEDTDNVQLSTYSRMPWYGGLGGGLGLAGDGIVTWKAMADLEVFYGSVSLLAAREAYDYTAELIENDIRATVLTASIIQRPTDRITLRGSYSYRDFSDDNYSHDVLAGVSCQILRKPAISVGYRFRYLNFDRQSRGGYFDPNDFIANSAFVNVSLEIDRLYGYIEPYFGYQTYDRYDVSHDDIFYGATGSLGYRINKWLAVEGNAEWGNYGGSTLSQSEDDWYYSQVGLRFIISL